MASASAGFAAVVEEKGLVDEVEETPASWRGLATEWVDDRDGQHFKGRLLAEFESDGFDGVAELVVSSLRIATQMHRVVLEGPDLAFLAVESEPGVVSRLEPLGFAPAWDPSSMCPLGHTMASEGGPGAFTLYSAESWDEGMAQFADRAASYLTLSVDDRRAFVSDRYPTWFEVESEAQVLLDMWDVRSSGVFLQCQDCGFVLHRARWFGTPDAVDEATARAPSSN